MQSAASNDLVYVLYFYARTAGIDQIQRSETSAFACICACVYVLAHNRLVSVATQLVVNSSADHVRLPTVSRRYRQLCLLCWLS